MSANEEKKDKYEQISEEIKFTQVEADNTVADFKRNHHVLL